MKVEAVELAVWELARLVLQRLLITQSRLEPVEPVALQVLIHVIMVLIQYFGLLLPMVVVVVDDFLLSMVPMVALGVELVAQAAAQVLLQLVLVYPQLGMAMLVELKVLMLAVVVVVLVLSVVMLAVIAEVWAVMV
jgi:hypothetical protein